MPIKAVQIDVIESKNGMYKCNLYTPGRCVTMYLHQHDYEALIKDGFFVRDGHEADSAGVLNTSEVYRR